MTQVSRGAMLPSSNMEQNKPYQAAASRITAVCKTCGTYFASGWNLLQEWMVLLSLTLILHQEVRREVRVLSTHFLLPYFCANSSVGQPQD